MKIVKHTFCKREKCSYIGMTCEIETTIKEVVDDHGDIIEEKYHWARLENGRQVKLADGDIEK